MHRHIRTTILCIGLIGTTIGCSSSSQSKPPEEIELMPDTSGETTFKLDSALANYRLPTSSIAPTLNANPDINTAIARMANVAIHQALIFDGRRANEGIIIVGRQGRRKPMLVAVAVYSKGNHIAMRDATSFNGTDFQAGQVMRDQFVNAL